MELAAPSWDSIASFMNASLLISQLQGSVTEKVLGSGLPRDLALPQLCRHLDLAYLCCGFGSARWLVLIQIMSLADFTSNHHPRPRVILPLANSGAPTSSCDISSEPLPE